jgi:hypothetical protein
MLKSYSNSFYCHQLEEFDGVFHLLAHHYTLVVNRPDSNVDTKPVQVTS